VLLLREETVVQVRPTAPRPIKKAQPAWPARRKKAGASVATWGESGAGQRRWEWIEAGARTGRCRDAASRCLARQRHRKNARYLAKSVPVTETGRRLSLEQVPTEGLRYW